MVPCGDNCYTWADELGSSDGNPVNVIERNFTINHAGKILFGLAPDYSDNVLNGVILTCKNPATQDQDGMVVNNLYLFKGQPQIIELDRQLTECTVAIPVIYNAEQVFGVKVRC